MSTDSIPAVLARPPQTTPISEGSALFVISSRSHHNGRQWSIIESFGQMLTKIFCAAISQICTFLESIKIYLTHLGGHSPEAANRFGHGIQNGRNSCYINSVVQALRFVPGFLPSGSIPDAQTEQRQALLNLHETIEGKEGQLKRCVRADEINEFRKLMIASGFGAVSKRSQEDAAQFCDFLLDQIGCPLIEFKRQVYHELNVPVPSLDRGHESLNHLELTLGTVPHGTELKDIALLNIVTEEVVASSILSRHDLGLTAECQKTLGALKPVEHIQTLQSTHLIENKIPTLLPIFLKRYSFDIGEQMPIKNKVRILPSKIIDFPLANHPIKKARFELTAMVIHDGMTLNGGHYVTYVPQVVDGRETYIEYDDSIVRMHCNPRTDRIGLTQTVANDVAENGYLYFYKFIGYK